MFIGDVYRVLKGMSVKTLKQRSRERIKDFKTRKKKSSKPKSNQRQSLIHEFYNLAPGSNQNIAGTDGDRKALDDTTAEDPSL